MTSQVITEVDTDFDLDRLFEFGLQRLLDGLRPLVTGASRETRPG